MEQLRLSIACTCRCGQPDCPPCSALFVQNSVGRAARMDERQASLRSYNKLADVFGQLRVAAQLMHMELNA